MPKYTVHLQRYVEQVTTIEVIASTIGEAVEMAEYRCEDDNLEWTPGDDVINGAAAEVGGVAYSAVSQGDDGEEWERN